MSRWLNGLLSLGVGVASIIGTRQGAEGLLRWFSQVDRGPLDPPLSAAEEEAQRRAYKSDRILDVVTGTFFVLLGIKNLLGL
jgi:hypothetical protein